MLKEQLKPAQNIHFIVLFVSFGLSVFLPVETLILGLIIIAPLHYMTEIFWLRRFGFFTTKPADFGLLTALAALFIIFCVLFELVPRVPFLQDLVTTHEQIKFIPAQITLIAVSTAGVMSFIEDSKKRMYLTLMFFAFSFVIYLFQPLLLLALITPNLLHLVAFTVLIMIFGLLNFKTLQNKMLLLLYLALITSAFFIPVSRDITVYKWMIDVFFASEYPAVSTWFLKIFNPEITQNEIFTSKHVFVIIRLFAFATLYHYVHWFIQCDAFKKGTYSSQNLILVVTGWVISVVLMFISVQIGIMLLLFLNIVHVYLEFPLIIQIIKSFKKST